MLTDPVLQGRVVGVLSSRTPKQGNPRAAQVVRNNGVTSSVQHLATTTRNRGVHDGKELPVAENAKVLCVLKGVSHIAFLGHMRKLGLDDFTAPTPTRSRAGLPYLSLKEAAGYLGCGADALLSTRNELLERLFDECTPGNGWTAGRRSETLREGGILDRWVSYKNDAGTVEVIVHAYFVDANNRRCSRIGCVLMERTLSSESVDITKYDVPDPSSPNVRRFAAVYGGGPAGVGETGSVVPAQRNGEVASRVQGGAAKTKATTPTRKTQQDSGPVPIRVNEFLVRRSYGAHRTNGHSLQPVRATVTILPKRYGDPRPVEFAGYWCSKCHKYFMTEETYLRLKRQGYICCKVVEERDLGTKRAGEGLYGDLASESVLHMYGYTVNQQDDLSQAERQTIISFVIENGIQTAQEVAHLLEWLISQREHNPRMAVAVGRWRADLAFVRHYHRPTRKVRVDSIYARL